PAATDEVQITIVDPGDPDPAPGPGTNLIANPSFEADDVGWSSWNGAITREQVAGAPNGVWVAKVTRTGGSGYTIDDAPTTVTSAVGGATYSARAFVRAASASSVGKTIRMYLRERTSSGGTVRTVAGPSFSLTTSFQAITHEIAPLAAGNQIELYIAQVGAGTGDAFQVDQIELTTGSIPDPPPPEPNQPPIPSFTNSPTSPQAGQTVTFTDTSTDPDGTIASRAWDLDGDGAYDDSAAAGPTFVYAAAGDVTVRLRVTDDDGDTATASRVITVTQAPLPEPPPSSNLVANPSFEVDDENWTSWNGAITREQVSGAPDGSWVGRVTRNSGTGFTIDDSPTSVLNAQGGVPYRARAMVKAASGSSVGKTIRIYLRERTGSGVIVRTVAGPSVILTDSFQAVTNELTPAAGNQLEIYIAQ
ncbi:MAG: PKD domain-containing protein, partial [Thermoleophilia bacterium]|nr:PKD domain-containing protein [Thermoleophilia bacterium]